MEGAVVAPRQEKDRQMARTKTYEVVDPNGKTHRITTSRTVRVAAIARVPFTTDEYMVHVASSATAARNHWGAVKTVAVRPVQPVEE